MAGRRRKRGQGPADGGGADAASARPVDRLRGLDESPSPKGIGTTQVLLTTSVRDVARVLRDLVPAYQHSFTREPWYEVSRCVAPSGDSPGCPHGYSPLRVGEICHDCGGTLQVEAYPSGELLDDWISRAASSLFAMYVERYAAADDGTRPADEQPVALGAIGWVSSRPDLSHLYGDLPKMQAWIRDHLPISFFYLSEIFSDDRVRKEGNLANLEMIVRQLAGAYDQDTFVFRSVNARLLRKTHTLFERWCTVYPGSGGQARKLGIAVEGERDVPDWRDIVVINGLS